MEMAATTSSPTWATPTFLLLLTLTPFVVLHACGVGLSAAALIGRWAGAAAGSTAGSALHCCLAAKHRKAVEHHPNLLSLRALADWRREEWRDESQRRSRRPCL